MRIYIQNINTFEKRNKVYKTQWRTIHKVIDEDHFNKYDIFQMILLKMQGYFKWSYQYKN